ncbi:trypanothione synthetase [Novymonas esmeraldas]|uniref:Trypanothione synthetase n=1 Tax=Novymonas esmeraldas TaxID=1808958 RepID=A0AAW0ENT6_9TRYP
MGSASSADSKVGASAGRPSRSPSTAGPISTTDTAGAPQMSSSLAATTTGRGTRRVGAVTLHDICGHTHHGVPAYSNGTSNTWTNTKSFRDGVFMGYQWQCVEFARRWLWSTQRLLLPERNCAYSFSSCAYVYRLKADTTQGQGREMAAAADALLASPSSEAITPAARVLRGPREDKDAWEKVPVTFIKQGGLVPPVASSLIVYPMSWGSPWGHIGVITEVDMERRLVYVADQNRYFHHWNDKSHSAVFPLECDKGRFYIRDHESECKGWMTFPTVVAEHRETVQQAGCL